MGKASKLPSVIDIIDSAEILGIGYKKDKDESCTGSIGEERKLRNIHPGIMYLAIPCPENCDECKVTKLGALKCTMAADGFFTLEGMVADSCPAEGYLEKGRMCISCSTNMNGRGCTTCEEQDQTDGSTMLACTACDSAMGLTLESVTKGNMTWDQCQAPMECEFFEFYNGTECTNCTAHCDFCHGPVCSICDDDHSTNILPDGTKECVLTDGGCPTGHFVNSHDTCEACDPTCETCFGKGPNVCGSCSDTSHVLVPMQMLRVERVNTRNELNYEFGKADYSLEYELPEDLPEHGFCAADCEVEGFALWDNDGVCQMCEPQGCSQCNAMGVCEECSMKQRLSLVDDLGTDPVEKYCAPCELLEDGCRMCESDDNESCMACEFPKFSLIGNDDGSKSCIKRCPPNMFKEMKMVDAADAPKTMKKLEYNECSDCDASCVECKGAADFCLLCTDQTKFALSDGTCADACPSGTFTGDGRCQKCGKNTETCEIDAGTGDYMVLTCETGFFKDKASKKCIGPTKCGKGYFADGSSNSCLECDATVCSECMGAADFCKKCKDVAKFVSSDGSCVDTPEAVTCSTGTFKNNAGICINCDKKCDSSAGCIGGGDSKCLGCANNMFALTSFDPTDGGSTLFKCGVKCPPLSEVAMEGGQKVCKTCHQDPSNNIFDISTKTCISVGDGCPAKTVLTTLDKISRGDNADALTYAGNATEVSICAKCDKK